MTSPEIRSGDRKRSFEEWRASLPASPRDVGRLHCIVIRPPGAEGERETRDAIDVSASAGLVGDKWGVEDAENVEGQVSLINEHVLRSLARDEEHMRLSGDNLQVDLDLSESNLPIGARLVIGGVTLEVTPLPHEPCESFVERFGKRAGQYVARGTSTGHRTRGVLCRVVAGGRMECGDEIRVKRR